MNRFINMYSLMDYSNISACFGCEGLKDSDLSRKIEEQIELMLESMDYDPETEKPKVIIGFETREDLQDYELGAEVGIDIYLGDRHCRSSTLPVDLTIEEWEEVAKLDIEAYTQGWQDALAQFRSKAK